MMEKLTAANTTLNTAIEARDRDFRTEINELDTKEKQLLNRLKLLDEKKLKVTLSNGDVDVSDDDLVEINVGGKVIAVSRSTLTQFKGTKLEALFSGRWDKILARDSSGRIFLDVNPICFQAIVDYLNEVKISTEENPAAPPIVESEYQDILNQQLDLFGLSDVLCSMDSKILTRNDHVTLLHNWLTQDSLDGRLDLLYRSSHDGRNDSTFHSKCDNKGPTLTVIETTEGHIIGGYSDVKCSSNGRYTHSTKAFLYAISRNGEFTPSRMKLTGSSNQWAVYCDHNSGPTFGGGHDDHDFCVHGLSLYLYTGKTYHSSPSQISGSRTFSIKEMEVFQVVPHSSSNSKPMEKAKTGNLAMTTKKIESFSSAVNSAINQKWTALSELESEVAGLEVSFEDEEKFITFFATKDNGDLILLNVCGSHVATTRQTLQFYEDSILASKILDAKKGESNSDQIPVKEWNTEDVAAWLTTVEGLDPLVVTSFEEDGVIGRELISLGKEDLMDFGVTRKGTIAYLLSEIEKLKAAPGTSSILIEHSPYCFEKIIDHLRLENLFIKGLVENKPRLPVVRVAEKSRFEKVVKHYFPGDISKSFL